MCIYNFMEDWVFGTTQERDKQKTVNILKERHCSWCVFLHIGLTAPDTWCNKKEYEPKELVCEYWGDLVSIPGIEFITTMRK